MLTSLIHYVLLFLNGLSTREHHPIPDPRHKGNIFKIFMRLATKHFRESDRYNIMPTNSVSPPPIFHVWWKKSRAILSVNISHTLPLTKPAHCSPTLIRRWARSPICSASTIHLPSPTSLNNVQEYHPPNTGSDTDRPHSSLLSAFQPS